MSTVELPRVSDNPPATGLPRIFELLAAGSVLLVFSPVLLLCAIGVALSSRGPVLFRQKRIGRRGEIFTLYKFRTMRAGVDGPQVTAKGDDRVTLVGRLLRATKLDELPELWNILKGDLSLVGPRPEVPRFVDLGNPLWRKVLRVRPGLTDPVTLRLRNEEALLSAVVGNRETFYRDVLQPYKLRGYADYLDRRTIWTDLEVLLRTAVAIVRPSTAPPPSFAELTRIAEGTEPDESQRSSTPPVGISLRHVQYLLDLVVLTLAFGISYALRFDFDLNRRVMADLLPQLPWVLAIQSGALLLAGVHRFIWRYVGIREAKRFLEAAIWSGLALLMLRLYGPNSFFPWGIPISVIVMDTVLGFGGVLGLRMLRRVTYEQERREVASTFVPAAARRRVLLLGAGQAGVLAAKEILGRGDLDISIQGFVDDDPRKQGALIHGIPVLGSTRDLGRLVAENGIQDVVITIAQISRREILRMFELCRKIKVSVRIIPGLYEILQGKVRVTRIRNVEIEDLLGRDRVCLDEEEIGRFVAGKAVLVTGAGGSIGSELARQLARFNPSSLLLLERAEFVLFDIDKELRRVHPNLNVVPIVADVGDEPWLRRIFDTHKPQVVFHAAAHKHVPMMESNPSEAIKNNVLGTYTLADVSAETGVEAFVMISTDKAVRPTSVMGASKRVAELVIQDLAARRTATRFVAVRFGNVMGSAGSVIPIFREQIQRGGPVTVTDPEMKRYFMTIPEAAQLVMQAGAMGRGGEIFILDMGDPVRILDLAVAMINLSGLRPFEEMEIVFTGLRPGEKLFEELELAGEEISKTRHPKIFIGRIAPYSSSVVQEALVHLKRLALAGTREAICEYLNRLLPEANLAGNQKLHPVQQQPSEIAPPDQQVERQVFSKTSRSTDPELGASPLG
ncbi:MAG: polysaccharide biosynthesis protein [Acidobacteria bacterium]|nr:polysaccharide biosynthesis protein [Acidobacteriota bacterium]MCA1612183.1 polysaccharide biosynthesis protein [Acidobacteriota bacterium]